MIHVEAPAKVNLSLRVSDPDRSGLHPLYSRVQMIDWHDYLTIEWSENDDLRIEGAADLPGGADDLPRGPENLVWRVAEQFWRAPRSRRPVSVLLNKQIPTAAGLAGGSADAAAMAVALETMVGETMDIQELAAVGSDIPFSVQGGGAIMEGYGERLAAVETPTDFALVVAVAPLMLSTPAVYGAWDRMGGPAGPEIPMRAIPPSLRAEPLVNDLFPAACHLAPELAEFHAELVGTWQRPVAMSGSGPALYGFFSDLEEAQDAASGVVGMRAVRALVPVSHGARLRSDENDYNGDARE